MVGEYKFDEKNIGKSDATDHTIWTESPQVNWYDKRETRQSWEGLYKSERVTLERVLPQVKTVLDIGCLNGDLFGALKKKYDIKYTGVDVDSKGIEIAKKNYPDAEFYQNDFLDEEFVLPKFDLVVSLNVFDHFKDWKRALKNYCRFSKRFVNFSTLLRLTGNTLPDPEASFIFYSGGKKRVLWCPHNVYQLVAYCSTEHINASSIYVYCYQKFSKEKNNLESSKKSVHPFPVTDLYVGNVIIELDESKSMKNTSNRPDVTIVVDDKVVYDSPWKS